MAFIVLFELDACNMFHEHKTANSPFYTIPACEQ